ncbi:MAG: type II toxin-antitoxin system HicA family toxin [Methylococcaceae bacterium]|nr:MAG: type II toxin-antitoxin system HicA family toxin [Methylococcaceae bacterium]
MTRRDKLFEKAWQYPDGLSHTELQTLLAQCGWQKRRQAGSHELWYSPQGFRLPIQRGENGQAKGYQVKQFLKRWEQEQ